jgi:hypothetical protein
MLAAGCGGVSATHSVSPATFLLPGLLKAAPQQPAPGASSNTLAAVFIPADSFRN